MDSRDDRYRYRQGLPDHHDVLAGVGGAPPAYSALTLRLVLASFGVLAFCAGGVAALLAHRDVLAAVFFAVALCAVVNVLVVANRKHRGEPG